MNYRNSTFKQKATKPMKRSKLRVVGVSSTAQDKKEIQRLVREIVMLRDKGCIFKNEKGHICSGYAPKSGHLVLQADHLLSRANSATFADTRLIVCVCKGIHGWKSVGSNLRKAEYDERVKKLIPEENLKLWEKHDQNKFPANRRGAYEWKLEIVALTMELNNLIKRKGNHYEQM